MLKKLSRKIGFTLTEIRVLLLLTVVFLVGLLYKNFYKDKPETEYKIFDYSKEDSAFTYHKNQILKDISEEKTTENKVDIKSEVLQLTKPDYNKIDNQPPLEEKSINLNTAGADLLERLPGIGEKTAEKIITYREKIKGFKSIDDLMQVNGIGTSKLNKIRKFLYIE
jgi:competence ComEA-like helix-hairpin-helix protein